MTAALLLVKLTARPPVAAAAFNETVQLSVPAPVSELAEQVSPLSTGTPVPLRAIVVDVPLEELLVRVTCPVTEPAAVGSYCTVSVAVWLEVSVSGKLAPEIVKPLPVTVAALTVTDVVPVDESVKVCVVGVLTATLPNARLVALIPRVEEDEPNCKANVFATVPALAVSVAVCAELTVETVAEKLALVAPAATVTVAGNVTAVLLLARFTAKPPVAAAAFRDTVQLSVPAPVSDPFAHTSPLRTGTPVPLRATVTDVPLEELLVSVSCPVAEPAAVGSNCNVRVAVWFGFRVTGNVAPETVKPLPATDDPLIVTAAVPVEVNVKACVVGVFTATLPNEKVVELKPRVGTDDPSCNANVFATPPALAVRVAVCAELTVETVAEKLALVAPAATVTVAGNVTAVLLLARFTAKPPVAAAAFRDTVQLSVPAPVSDPFAHTSPLRTGTPVPLRATVTDVPLEELLVSVSCPVAEPAAVGSNCSVRAAV